MTVRPASKMHGPLADGRGSVLFLESENTQKILMIAGIYVAMGIVMIAAAHDPRKHKAFIDFVNNIHELDRKLSELEVTKRKKEKAVAVSSAQKKADEIFEKFKRGDKLSTEDLMILQKAGLI